MTVRRTARRVNRAAAQGVREEGSAGWALAVPESLGVPRYLRLRNALAGAISDGRWAPGAQLPAEYELAARAGLSVGTVQRALSLLVDEGVLVRRHGAGTFVSRPEVPLVASFLHSQFVDDETGELLPVFAHVPRRSTAPKPGPWSRHLQGGQVMCLERTQSVAREFLVYTRLYFDASRFPTLAEADTRSLDGMSLKDSLSRELRNHVARYTHWLQVKSFPRDVCRSMRQRRACVGTILEIAAYDRTGGVVYFQDFHIPPNSRRLVVTR